MKECPILTLRYTSPDNPEEGGKQRGTKTLKHQPFRFKASAELLGKAEELGLKLPFQESIEPLFDPANINGKRVPNRLAVQPMEGFDSEPDGSPSLYTFRRYKRYAAGGSGLIWFEATSVLQEGRSNPHQLMLTEHTLDGFRKLVEQTRESARQASGDEHEPYLVLQITHSGRYSKPGGKPLGKVACYNPCLDKQPEDVTPFSDQELEQIKTTCINAARLCREAGFDAVDVKACHGYLVHELLGAHNRLESRFGGSFENRKRFLVETVQEIHSRIPEIDLAVRLNVYDGIPFPYGFGVSEDGSLNIDLTEPKALIAELIENGCSLMNITLGIPYHSPQLVRPFDFPVAGTDVPDEHPLQGVVRFLEVTGQLQREFSDIPFVGSGFSWLRQYIPNVGAASMANGGAAFVGLGRSSFAYPDAPADLMEFGKMDTRKVCISCSKCSELMRLGSMTGCVTRDTELYTGIYRQLKRKG